MPKPQLFQKPMLFVFFLLIASFCFSQVTEQWVKRYNGPQNFLDEAHSLAVDASGNVYVTGGSYGSDDNYDYATIKYDAAGTELWTKRYNGPAGLSYNEDRPYSIAVDGFGNVYVTGYSNSNNNQEDYATIKYNAAGTELWVKRYDGPANSSDRAFSLAVDGTGNVYVTGFSFGTGGTYDYATLKYDTDGKLLWTRRYDGLGQDQAVALTTDASGNVYVTGYSYNDDSQEDYATIQYTTIKYNTQGTEMWVRTYRGAYGGSFASSLAVDVSGNVYVTGRSSNDKNDEQVTDYATIKYDAAGAELWVKRYNGNGRSRNGATALAVDASGNVYVIGGSMGNGTNSDYATIKYDAAGAELWVKRYNGPGNSDDAATSLAIDQTGNVYVAGYDYDSASDNNYATIKYDAGGNEQWLKRYNGPGNLYDAAADLAVDSNGNVYVTGQSYSRQTSADYATIKYSQAQTAVVSSFTLMNADNDEAIRELKDGDTLNLAALPSLQLNIRANTNPQAVGSVVFNLSGTQTRKHTENITPYALFADDNNEDYYSWTPANGDYILTATPYSAAKGGGKKGTSATIRFHVIYQKVTSFTLVNADTDKDITILRSGDVINLSELTTKNLNIRANTHPSKAGSVVFNLSGQATRGHIENIVPYALFADNNKGDYYGWMPQAGNYLLTATPYEHTKGRGNKGAAYTIAFSVVSGAPSSVTTTTALRLQKAPISDAATAKKESLTAIPNPFVGETRIRFSVPISGRTLLAVYDIKGTIVERLYEASAEAGKLYSVSFKNKQLPAGLYVVKLTTGSQAQSYKLVLMR